jgi:hypothetical protein
MNFKQTLKILLSILTVNLAFAQDKIKHNYEICNSLFSLELKKNFDKNFNDSFILKKELSYAYYIDSKTMQNVNLEFENSNSIDCVPYQYVLKYQPRSAKCSEQISYEKLRKRLPTSQQ